MDSLSRAVTVSLIALCTFAASAQVSSTSMVTGSNGKTATRSTVRGGGNVQSTTTGPNGQTGTRSVSRSAGSTNATVTGPNGQSAGRSTTYGTNDLDWPQRWCREPQRLGPGHRHRNCDYDRTARSNRDQGPLALTVVCTPTLSGWPRSRFATWPLTRHSSAAFHSLKTIHRFVDPLCLLCD
jgi:hypothetical protein